MSPILRAYAAPSPDVRTAELTYRVSSGTDVTVRMTPAANRAYWVELPAMQDKATIEYKIVITYVDTSKEEFPGGGNLHPTRISLLNFTPSTGSLPLTVFNDEPANITWSASELPGNDAGKHIEDDEGPIVAVLSTGLDAAGCNIPQWTNQAEQENGIDDDHNDIVDDIHGARWFKDNNVISKDGNITDDSGSKFGTFLADRIVRRWNNAQGLLSGRGIRIMALKVVDDVDQNVVEAIGDAIAYATNKKTDVICIGPSMRWGNQNLDNAIQALTNTGTDILAVCGAGQEREDIDGADAPKYFPASEPSLNALLTLAASDTDSKPTQTTNWGPTSVDIADLGENVVGCVGSGLAKTYSSTVISAAGACGVAAALKARVGPYYANSAPELIKYLLEDGTKPTGDYWKDLTVSKRVINYDGKFQPVPWLTLTDYQGTLASGAGTGRGTVPRVEVSVNAAGFPAGTYYAVIAISGTKHTPLRIPVTLTVP